MSAVISLLMVFLAQATPPGSHENAPARTRANALVKEGSTLLDGGNAAGALEKFLAAYTEYPSPKLYFDIGTAELALDKRLEALQAFETFLLEAFDANPKFFEEAKAAVKDLKTKLGQLRIDCPTSGATVAIDGRLLGITPLRREIWAMPGTHRLTVLYPRHADVSRTIEIVAGQTQTIEQDIGRSLIRWKPAPPETPAVPAPMPPGVSPGPPAAEQPLLISRTDASAAKPWWQYRWYTWTFAGQTILFTAVAIIAGASADSRFDSLHTTCGSTSAGCPESQIDTVKSRAAVANVFWALAGVSAVATGVGLYVESRGTEVSIAWRF